MTNIEVSVYCMAYNHEAFIEDALKGFVMQKTNFKYEVFVHDDASTDGTALIIKKYADMYPDIIKPIFQTVNQYSQGVQILKAFILPKMSGKYIAICEGDDCWTDDYKLQKQFDALESHPECDMCAHKAEFYDCVSQKVEYVFPSIKENRILSPEEVIYGDGGLLPTASLFYRKEMRLTPMNFQQYWGIDYTLQIRGSLRGGIVFLSDVMSLYRFLVPGSWTVRNCNLKQQKSVFEKKQTMLSILNEETGYKYKDIIDKKKRKNLFNINIAQDNYKELLKSENKEFLYELEPKERLKIYIKAYFPFLYKTKRLIKK